MTSIYLIRHAQAQGNVLGRFQGRTDHPLTKEGERQAALLATRFLGVPLDAVYTSPLTRARQTAAALCASKGLVPLFDEALTELHGGDMEDQSYDTLKELYPEEVDLFDNRPHLFRGVGPDGESMADLHARINRAIDDIEAANLGRTVAVVSHGCAIRCVLCRLMGWPISRLRKVDWNPNTGVSHIVYPTPGNAQLIRWGDDSHLGVDSVAAKLKRRQHA